MNVQYGDLARIRDMCIEQYNLSEKHLVSIILYGGAAKTYVGQEHKPGDFDLNLFYHEDADMTSTAGMPEKIGEYDGLKVEVMRNQIREGQLVKEYILNAGSKRWDRIRAEPIVEIYPTIRPLDWFKQ